MFTRNIKVVDDIAQIITVIEDACRRGHRQLKTQTALAAFRARLHPHFHHTLVNWGAVTETSHMANGVIHILLYEYLLVGTRHKMTANFNNDLNPRRSQPRK